MIRSKSVVSRKWFDRQQSCDTFYALTELHRYVTWLQQALDCANYMTSLLQIKYNVFTFYCNELPSKTLAIFFKEQSTMTYLSAVRDLKKNLVVRRQLNEFEFSRFNVQSNLRYEQSYFLLLSIARRPYRVRTALNAYTTQFCFFCIPRCVSWHI